MSHPPFFYYIMNWFFLKLITKPQLMLNRIQTGNNVPDYEYCICGIAQAHTYRKENIVMQRRLVVSNTCIRCSCSCNTAQIFPNQIFRSISSDTKTYTMSTAAEVSHKENSCQEIMACISGSSLNYSVNLTVFSLPNLLSFPPFGFPLHGSTYFPPLKMWMYVS